MLRLFLFQAVLIFASFYFSSLLFKGFVGGLGFHGIADPAALPLLVLVVGLVGMVLTPLTAMFTRFVEGQADNFALRVTGDPDSFISAMARLTDQNLAEGAPPRWVELFLEDHPSYRQRLAAAQKFRDAK
jgi:STE24 endopeptidase